MSMSTRMEEAAKAVTEARKVLWAWEDVVDLVEQRRLMVKAAKLLRKAANELDDEGRITE